MQEVPVYSANEPLASVSGIALVIPEMANWVVVACVVVARVIVRPPMDVDDALEINPLLNRHVRLSVAVDDAW